MAKSRLHNSPSMRKRRKELRARLTPAEARLWQALRRRQLKGRKFRRQHSIGRYVVDFYCVRERLAIEVDGAAHEDPQRKTYDAEREAFLAEQGVEVLRFTNEQVRAHLPEVLAAIARAFGRGEQ